MNDLRIVRDNDFYLKVPVRSIIFFRDGTNTVVRGTHPVNLAGCSSISVNLVCSCDSNIPVSFTINDSELRVKCAAGLECGWYGLEVRYEYSGRKYRSYERKVFKIVENNAKSFVSGEQYEGEQSYVVDTMWTLMSVVDEVELDELIRQDSMRFTEEEIESMLAYVHDSGANSARMKGSLCTASGSSSHAEGFITTASGASSHAEGQLCHASGDCSHAGGLLSQASGNNSFAHGLNVRTSRSGGFALGAFNDDQAQGGDGEGDYLIGSIGGGYSDENGAIIRRNIIEFWRNGGIVFNVNGEKVRLQDNIFLLWKLITALLNKEVISSEDISVVDKDDFTIIKNEDTIVGLEVKTWGFDDGEDIGDKFANDEDNAIPQDAAIPTESDDVTRTKSTMVGIDVQKTIAFVDKFTYRIATSDTVKTKVDKIWNDKELPVLSYDNGNVEVPVIRVAKDRYIGEIATGDKIIKITIDSNKILVTEKYNPDAWYYYNSSIGNWG